MPKYPCQYPGCTKVCLSPEYLHAHHRTHQGLKPFACTVPGCNSAFGLMSNLKAHMQVHDAYRNYPCPVEHCGKSFKREAKVREHLRTKHPEYHQQQEQLTRTNGNPRSASASPAPAKYRRMSIASDHSGCSGAEVGNTTDDDDDDDDDDDELENEEEVTTNTMTLQHPNQNQCSSSAAAVRPPSALQYSYLSPSSFTLPTALNLSQSPIFSPSSSPSSYYSPASSPTSPHSSWQQYLPPITSLFTPAFKGDLLLTSMVTMPLPDSEITRYREKISVTELLNN